MAWQTFFLLFSFRPFNYSLLVGINLISHSIIFILSMFYSPKDSITPLSSSFDDVSPCLPSSIPRNFFNWTIKALYNTTSTKEEFTPLLILPLPLAPTSNSPIHHFALPAPPRTLQDKGTATEKVSQILRLSFRSAAAPFSHSNCARHDSAFIATASTVAFALLNNVSSVRQSFRLNWRVITTTSGALRCAAKGWLCCV